MKKNIVLLFSGLLFFGLLFGNAYALDAKITEEARIEAEKEIKEYAGFEQSSWYKKNPRIVKKTPFYSNSDSSPSYIEYKISCDGNKNCGYIIVNIDGTDARIPMSGFSSPSISEQLGSSQGSKNYYFNIFTQYSVSNDGNITAINPMEKKKSQVALYKSLEGSKKYAKENKNKFQKKQIEMRKMKQRKKTQAHKHTQYKTISSSNFTGGSCNFPIPYSHQGEKNYWSDTGCTQQHFQLFMAIIIKICLITCFQI